MSSKEIKGRLGEDIYSLLNNPGNVKNIAREADSIYYRCVHDLKVLGLNIEPSNKEELGFRGASTLSSKVQSNNSKRERIIIRIIIYRVWTDSDITIAYKAKTVKCTQDCHHQIASQVHLVLVADQ